MYNGKKKFPQLQWDAYYRRYVTFVLSFSFKMQCLLFSWHKNKTTMAYNAWQFRSHASMGGMYQDCYLPFLHMSTCVHVWYMFSAI